MVIYKGKEIKKSSYWSVIVVFAFAVILIVAFPPLGAIVIIVGIALAVKIHKHNKRVEVVEFALEQDKKGINYMSEKETTKAYKQYKKEHRI